MEQKIYRDQCGVIVDTIDLLLLEKINMVYRYMKLELLIFGITGFLIMNTYYDGKYTKMLMLGQKYFKMAMFG